MVYDQMIVLLWFWHVDVKSELDFHFHGQGTINGDLFNHLKVRLSVYELEPGISRPDNIAWIHQYDLLVNPFLFVRKKVVLRVTHVNEIIV